MSAPVTQLSQMIQEQDPLMGSEAFPEVWYLPYGAPSPKSGLPFLPFLSPSFPHSALYCIQYHRTSGL